MWSERFTIEYPGFAHGALMFEYDRGVYSHGKEDSISLIQFCWGSNLERTLLWEHSLDLSICAYTTDASQDLLILVVPSFYG
jgi:hypothetical protein